MKLLIISQYFYPERFIINELASALVLKGHEVTVITSVPTYPRRELFKSYKNGFFFGQNYNGINVIRVPMYPRGTSHLSLILNYSCYIFFSSMLAIVLASKIRFDSVLVFGLSPIFSGLAGSLYKKIVGTRLVIWVQDLWPESLVSTGYIKSGFILGVVRECVLTLYRSADLLLVQSKMFVPSIRSMGFSGEIDYLPNTIFMRRAIHEAADISTDMKSHFSISFAGNLGSLQNIPLLLDCAEELRDQPEIKFFVFGDGSKKRFLESEIRSRCLTNIRLCGHIEFGKLTCLLGDTDVLFVALIPGGAMELTIPSKIQYYLALGKPIIASIDGSGSHVVIESGGGLSSPAGDYDLCVENIKRLFNMTQEERDNIGYCQI